MESMINKDILSTIQQRGWPLAPKALFKRNHLYLTLVLPALILSTTLNAQQHGIFKDSLNLHASSHKNIDTTTLRYAFMHGKTSAHLRYFFMSTQNAGSLTDYYAHAIGGGLKYETAPYHGFQLGMSGFYIFNIGSSNLAEPDAKTNQPNRYERSLFDIEDPSNKSDIDRLEELYVKYAWKNSKIIFGRQLINTPFINLQDGRMRPSEVAGLWAEINDIKNTRIEAGWIKRISPRNTVKWHSVGESIGIYPAGVNEEGSPSSYAGQVSSKGIAMVGITHKSGQLKLQAWNVFVENVFNTSMLQADLALKNNDGSHWIAGAQYIFQAAIKDGGNKDPHKTYYGKGMKAQTFGARLGWENARFSSSINYNRITALGRFLMPREWGKEPFYTFLPRERNEGTGDMNAYMFRAAYELPAIHLKTGAGFGYYALPEVTHYALNKYGLPSYTQLNLDLNYAFTGWLEGLEAELLYVYKNKLGNSFGNDKYVINKVDMAQWNIVLNYEF